MLSAGRRLAHDVLAEASGLGGAELRAVVREAAESNVIVADERGRYQFRHALLREVVHDDLLPGEHAELHLALARALEHQAEETGEDALITAGIAHHYLSAGAQREALVASVRAADAAERVHAHGEAGALLERALDLWPRVPDADGAGRLRPRRAAAPRRPRADQRRRLHPRRGAAAHAVGEVDEAADPRRAADLLELLSRAQWSLGRASDVARLDRPRGRAAARRTTTARSARGSSRGRRRPRCCRAASARRCRPPRRRSAPRGTPTPTARCADALNAMGYSQILLGEVEDGQRPAARGDRDLAPRVRAHQRVGQPRRGAAPRRPLAARGWPPPSRGSPTPRARGASATGCRSALLDIRWALGDWEAARAALPPRDKRHIGMTLAYVETLRAAVALADGEHDEARASLDRAADVIQGSREPQFLGWFGSLRGELERRCGDLAAARAAIDDGLDAIEFCSEDLPRIALLSETGAAIEADAAQRARDLGDDDGRARGDLARRGLRDARRGVRRRRAAGRGRAARDGPRAPGPRPRRGRPGARRRRGRGVARGRAPVPGGDRASCSRAETLVARGERDDAAAQLADVLAAAEALGAPWLRGRGRGPRRPRAAAAPDRRRGGAGARAAAGRGPVRAHAARAPGARAASPTARRTARSARSSSWPRRPRACTCRASSPSSTSAAAPRRPPSRTASALVG